MSGEAAQLLSRRQVPELHRVVGLVGCNGATAAIGERDRSQAAGWVSEDAEQLTRLQVPQLQASMAARQRHPVTDECNLNALKEQLRHAMDFDAATSLPDATSGFIVATT
jgi:hypothetical protein